MIYGADEADDWTSPKVWKKANPSLGITVDIEKLEAACESARQNPAEGEPVPAASALPVGKAGCPLDAHGKVG